MMEYFVMVHVEIQGHRSSFTLTVQSTDSPETIMRRLKAAFKVHTTRSQRALQRCLRLRKRIIEIGTISTVSM